MRARSRESILVALGGNILVFVTKSIAASITGSSAMLSEAIHSLVDTSDELLLLYGLNRSHARPDENHPLGYGREFYFWSFIVALLVLALGSGVSIWEGIRKLQHPEPSAYFAVSYVVLFLSLSFEGASWVFTRRQSRKRHGNLNAWAAIRASKDPAQFTVMLEDVAAISGIAIAFGCTLAAQYYSEPRFDGAASVLIGLLLAGVAAELARKCKGLLIGERADPELRKDMLRIAKQCTAVERVNGIIAVQLAPDQVVAALSLQFKAGLNTDAIEQAVNDMELELRIEQPTVRYLFVKPQDRASFYTARRRSRIHLIPDHQERPGLHRPTP